LKVTPELSESEEVTVKEPAVTVVTPEAFVELDVGVVVTCHTPAIAEVGTISTRVVEITLASVTVTLLPLAPHVTV